MEKIKVLLVEDEQTLAMIIKDTLEAQGFEITVEGNGRAGLERFFSDNPDVLVTDVMMPEMDGFEMVRQVRKQDTRTPVLFLTARSNVNDVVKGFETGANDYLKKPFGMQELIVRIKALVERMTVQEESKPASNVVLSIGRYTLDIIAQRLCYCGEDQELSHRETEILRMLVRGNCQVVLTKDILLELWGDDSFWNGRSLQVFITKLRHKLAKDPSIRIINVRGIGYKLIEQKQDIEK